MVYFLQRPEGGLIKIGKSIRLTERLKVLSDQAGCQLRVLAVIDGNYPEERSLHLRFDHLRVDLEWFDPAQELIDFIAREARPWDGRDEAPPPLGSGRIIAFALKSCDNFKKWLQDSADAERIGVPDFIDRALAEYARNHGLPDPPKR